jgi:hypothetical protein
VTLAEGRTNANINTANRSFEDAEKIKCLGTTLTDQNCIHEEIQSTTLNSGNTCYRSVQSLLYYRLLSRSAKVEVYKTIILPVVFMGVKLGLTLREEHRLRVFDNRVLRRIFGPKRDEVTGGWMKLQNEEFRNLYSSPDIVMQNK